MAFGKRSDGGGGAAATGAAAAGAAAAAAAAGAFSPSLHGKEGMFGGRGDSDEDSNLVITKNNVNISPFQFIFSPQLVLPTGSLFGAASRPPSIDFEATPSEVAASVGRDATLVCRVTDLGQKSVSNASSKRLVVEAGGSVS